MDTTEWCHWSAKKVEEGELLRESVRRLLIPVLKRCADHPIRCDFSDDANIALTAFLAENKEITP